MAKVSITRSEAEGFYTGTAGEFRISIERTGNKVPRSIDLVLLGLGTCTISTVATFMERKGWPAQELAVELSAEFDDKAGSYKDFSVVLHTGKAVTDDMRRILLNVAKTCRIHKTLDARPHVAVDIVD